MSVSIEQVYAELKKIEENMVTKKEIENLIDTIEILGNPDTMGQICGSLEDIKKGNFKEISSIQDLMVEF